MQRIENSHAFSKSSQSKKRKSSEDLYRPGLRDYSPPASKRVKKLRSSERVKNMLKAQTKSQSGRPIHRKYYTDFYEEHPIKKLSTSIRPKPVKHKGPVTRASSHLKTMMTTAKLAAARKLRMLRRTNQIPARDYNRSSHTETVKRSSSGTPKKSSPTSLSQQKSSPSSAKKGNIVVVTELYERKISQYLIVTNSF